MKRHSNILLFLFLGLVMVAGACSNDATDDMPGAISSFLAHYFPGIKVKSYSDVNEIQTVQLSGGPTLRFDEDDQWTDIDGNGSYLPQVLMYDELPTQLYDYLQATEQQSDVTAVKRDRHYYKLIMLDTVITYEISTGEITYPTASDKGRNYR
ncbi:MAG: hypothetical protein HDS40_03225 [Bacteroides sp.]|nr:hypothetical protein [Bacteroides sp.]